MSGIQPFREFNHQVRALQQKVSVLTRRNHMANQPNQQLSDEMVEQLQVAMEELSVADEELRQQAESLAFNNKLLEEERRKYQDLFDFAPDAYLVTDLHGKILEANAA